MEGDILRASLGTSLILLLALAGARETLAATPGEVGELSWCAGSTQCLTWDPATPTGQYRVHRGTSSTLPGLVDGTVDSCLEGTFGATTTGPVVTGTPAAGTMFWYLVVAETCTSEGAAGTGSLGPEMVNAGGDCVAATWADGVRDGAETDVDCGGSCAPCAAATCSDGIRNGAETDVDCGGTCPGCATNQLCSVAGDCQSSVCTNGHCVAPTCADGVMNGSETDVDCGGGSCGPCGLGAACLAAGDCASQVCQAGVCAVESCTAGPGLPGGTGSSCGPSGNTYWSFPMASTATGVALNGTDIYLSAGSRLSRVSQATGSEENFQTFSGVTLRQPIDVTLKGGLSEVLYIAGSNGYAYSLNPVTLVTNWSRSLQRTGYGTDSVTAPPVIQLWTNSDPDYRAARNLDMLMFGTHYSTSTTSNRVYGLDASNGTVVWIFNPTGSYQMDTVNGLVVDYARDLVYVVSDWSGQVLQNTVWALRTTTGARVWAWALGAIDAEPALANGGLYVGTRSGVLYKLDPATGTTIWQRTITTVASITHVVADGENGVVYVVDSVGTLHAVTDQCASGAGLWDFKPTFARVTAAPAVLDDGWRYVYVGADDGKVWQVRASDGVAHAYATVSSVGAASNEEPVVFYDGSLPMLLARSGGNMKRLCIPWPDTAGDKAHLRLPPGLGPDPPAGDPRIAFGPLGLPAGWSLGRVDMPPGVCPQRSEDRGRGR